MKRRLFLVFTVAYYVFYSFLYSGWLFHKSGNPVLFQYSKGCVLFLLVMLLPFFIPLIIRSYVRRVGWKGFFLAMILFIVFISMLYWMSSLFYYRRMFAENKYHLFDPYLQMSPQRFDETEQKDYNTFRILILGGSTSMYYPNLLREFIQEHHPSRKIEILNGSNHWYTAKHSLITYVTYYYLWKPDLVVIMHGINDLSRSFSPRDWAIGEYDDLWNHYYGASIKGARPGLLIYRQYLYKEYLSPFAYAWFSNLRFGEREREMDYPLGRYVSIDKFRQYLISLLKYVKGDGADIMLVSQPSIYKSHMEGYEKVYKTLRWHIFNTPLNDAQIEYPSAASLENAMNEINKIVSDMAISEGVFFVDAAGAFPKDRDYFIDDLHYTDKGSRLMAEIIGEKIIASSIIEKSLPGEKRE
ncbi:MAG: hypothetical protein JW800_05350 [Candidatus Omnitrophica bacterium]|nr:hypothetical protein [Candidatus Omnitrophota bacterium]